MSEDLERVREVLAEELAAARGRADGTEVTLSAAVREWVGNAPAGDALAAARKAVLLKMTRHDYDYLVRRCGWPPWEEAEGNEDGRGEIASIWDDQERLVGAELDALVQAVQADANHEQAVLRDALCEREEAVAQARMECQRWADTAAAISCDFAAARALLRANCLPLGTHGIDEDGAPYERAAGGFDAAEAAVIRAARAEGAAEMQERCAKAVEYSVRGRLGKMVANDVRALAPSPGTEAQP